MVHSCTHRPPPPLRKHSQNQAKRHSGEIARQCMSRGGRCIEQTLIVHVHVSVCSPQRHQPDELCQQRHLRKLATMELCVGPVRKFN